MEQGEDYHIPQNDSLFLESIATDSEEVSSAYAQAILSLLFGREFYDVLLEENLQQVEEYTKPNIPNTRSEKEKIIIIPNPAKDQFEVFFKDVSASTLVIRDINSYKIHEQVIPEGSDVLSISSVKWNSGLYFLQIADSQGKTLHSQPLLITK